MRPSIRSAIAVSLAAGLASAAQGEEAKSSKGFERSGVIVDLHAFFTAIDKDEQAAEHAHQGIAGRALVTEEGLYAFLETPHNTQALEGTEHGSVVRIKGRVIEEGALLHVDKLEKINKVPLIDFARFRSDPGQQVVLKGVNKCQCGLDVGDLPHSCQLGHLHHLEAENGRIYHYLPSEAGTDAFLGRESHFKPVEISGRVLPGNFLLVEALKVD
jgi:hypothetical protein